MIPGRIVGRCEVCQLPVLAQSAERVPDRAVMLSSGRPKRRLAHQGDCARDLRARIGRPA